MLKKRLHPLSFTLGLTVLFVLLPLVVGFASDPIGDISNSGDTNAQNIQMQNDTPANNNLQSAVDKISGAIANKIVDSIIGSNSSSKQDSTNINNVKEEPGIQAKSSNESQDNRNNGFQGITCPNCGYSSAYFPYVDKSKLSIRCPSCGSIIIIKY